MQVSNLIKSLASLTLVIGLALSLGGTESTQTKPTASPAIVAEDAPLLTVEIASPEHFHKRVLAIDQPFLVVVANASKQPLRVWRDWCSWGYQQLSFEITDSAGRTWNVRRKEHGFNKNYPDFWSLDAGEPLVLSVTLGSDIWECDAGLTLADLKGKAVTIRAIFAAEEDDQSRQNKVWSGRVTSTPHMYELE